MKWRDPGNEFEKESARISKKFENIKGIVIFGCGILGKEAAQVLDAYGLFDCFLDNDTKKQIEGWKQYKVCDPHTYVNSHSGMYYVVAADAKNTQEIERFLKDKGLKRGDDYTNAMSFMRYEFPILSYSAYKKLYVELAQISLTERCTLKCKKCAHACNLVPITEKDMSFKDIKKSADCFFNNIDFVKEFVLIGGEPLLSKELKNAVRYIGEKYRDQIFLFTITTNGTITPDDELIALCKKYNVTLRLSDYSKTLPRLKERYNTFMRAVMDIDVLIWETNAEDSWYDYGFFDIDNGNDEKELIKVFDRCRTPCREVRGSKYYYCVMARSVSENTKRGIGLDEFFDLSGDVDKSHLFEFEMGYSDKGYLSMCRYCRGNDATEHRIPAAEQELR